MKRILTLLLSLALLVSCLSFPAFAENSKNLQFEVSVDGKNELIVNAGDKITVDFTVENMTDDAGYAITNLQNEIEFDDDFFEFTEGDVALVTAYFSRYADDYSWGAKRVQILARHIDGGKPKAYEDKQLVARVTFKVKDGLAKGTSGKLENKVCEAAEAISGVIYTTSSKGMTVYIGDSPEEKYTVTYKNGETVVNTDDNAAAGSTIKIYSGLTDADKKFAGWQDADGKLWQPGEDYTVTKDTTFTAAWLHKYTLTFNTNGGTAVADKVAWENEDITLSDCSTTKNGYTFEGWYEDAELTKPVTTLKLSADKTIYAKWKEVPAPTKYYTLTFDTNGGSTIASEKMESGTVISLSTYKKPTRSGYSFVGWCSDEGLTKEITSVTLSADTTVYANWKKNSTGSAGGTSIAKYTLSFETDGGIAVKSVDKVRNTTVDLSKYITTKEGYSFDGWHTDKELTKKVTSVKMTSDITLYAKWVEGEGGQTQTPNYRPDIMSGSHDAYILGREDGLIHPEAKITRAEAATIFFRLLDEEVRTEGLTRENSFTDVKEGDWFNTAVSTLANLEVLTGRTEDTFAPNAPITRAELTTIVARLSEAAYEGEDLFTDIGGHWARKYINIAASIRWVQGENNLFRPDDNMTRAEVVTLINRALDRRPESAEDLADDMTVWQDNTDTNAWYYLEIQEATHSHTYEMKADGTHEVWTELSENPDWTAIEK